MHTVVIENCVIMLEIFRGPLALFAEIYT